MIQDLFKWIKQSKITTIGYDHRTENEKDLILKKIKSYNISENYKYFITKQIIRDIKLNHILNDGDDYRNFYHLDISDIQIPSKDTNIGPYERSVYIKEIIFDLINIRSKIDNVNFIITTKTYNTLNNQIGLKGGNSVVYLSDLVFHLEKEKIKITKNIYSSTNIDISLSDLKNFNYICDYEHNK